MINETNKWHFDTACAYANSADGSSHVQSCWRGCAWECMSGRDLEKSNGQGPCLSHFGFSAVTECFMPNKNSVHVKTYENKMVGRAEYSHQEKIV